MSEHWCKECKNSKGDTCDYTGATHTTGIECPSFGDKEKEIEMSFRVRRADDFTNIWTVADGDCCNTTNEYITKDGTVGHCKVYETEREAQAAFDLYLEKQPELTSVDPPKEVLEVKGASPTAVRTFDSGAIRDTDEGKLDYVKALSPIVLRRYVQYLDKHRLLPDGSYRDFDNWKSGDGIPQEIYHSSGGRHFFDTWLLTEGYATEDNHGSVDLEDSLCAQLFNIQGRIKEILEVRLKKEADYRAAVDHEVGVDRTAPVPGGY